VVNVSTREQESFKKKNVVRATKSKASEDRISILKGTTSDRYMQFINDTLYITDNFPEI
ncbi:hypothetical protein BDF14DRAFT_1719738, partial [Spinellus fusiger]